MAFFKCVCVCVFVCMRKNTLYMNCCMSWWKDDKVKKISIAKRPHVIRSLMSYIYNTDRYMIGVFISEREWGKHPQWCIPINHLHFQVSTLSLFHSSILFPTKLHVSTICRILFSLTSHFQLPFYFFFLKFSSLFILFYYCFGPCLVVFPLLS